MDKHEGDVGWIGAMNLEEAIRKAFREGKEAEMLPILQCLPVPAREKYRLVWAEEQNKRRLVRT